VIHAAFSLVSSVLFFVVALLLVVADHELEPMSRSLLAAPHSMTELRMLLCKTVITASDILLRPAPHYQVTLYAGSCVLMLWYQIRWVCRLFRRAAAGCFGWLHRAPGDAWWVAVRKANTSPSTPDKTRACNDNLQPPGSSPECLDQLFACWAQLHSSLDQCVSLCSDLFGLLD